ncbi:MAG: recombinase family protein [Clostridia bacterium]|nr:recombinase family protein [Clostridia bacterium]
MADITVINQALLKANSRQRVCAYCRVSTNSADQLNSYARQIRVHTELIKRNPDWEMVDIFADEGISGTSANKRPEFQRMIGMCEKRKIDRIITKSVSRFARNVKEALEFVRKLKILGVGVQFEKEGIYTLSMGDEMLLNTFAAIAEEESVETSIRLRNANKKRMADGDFIDGNAPYGFRLIDRTLVRYDPEAETVERIFSAYLSGKSTHEIARMLNEEGIPSRENNTWKSTAIKYILKNEKYKGDYLCQKTYHTDVLPYRQKRNYGEEDRFYIEGSHEGIVPREIFDRANEIMKARREKIVTGETAEPEERVFSGKIVCCECGCFFNRKKSNGAVYWACAKHLEGRELCPSHYIRQERIEDAFITMVNKLRFGKDSIISKSIALLEEAKNAGRRGNGQAFDASRQIADLNSKLLMLEQLNSKGYLATEVYHMQSRELTQKISELKRDRSEMLTSALDDKLSGLKELDSVISSLAEPLGSFKKSLFDGIVERVTINGNDNVEFTVKGGLRFTEPL